VEIVALIGVGLSWREARLDSLAHFGRHADQVIEEIDRQLGEAIRSRVVLSTCNRFEIVADVEAEVATEVATRIQSLLNRHHPSPARSETFVVRHGIDVVRHLFRIATGLESVLVGETEITGQVRTAVREARNADRTNHVIERLFDSAIATSRRVRRIGTLSDRSLLTLGLDLAEQQIGGLTNRSVLIIGTGAYARAAVSALLARGVDEIFVHSPSGRRSVWSIDHRHSTILDIGSSALPDALSRVDLAVGCSGRNEPVVGPSQMIERTGRPLVVVDLSLSPDFHPSIADLVGVTRVGLEKVFALAESASHVDTSAADDIIGSRVDEFVLRYLVDSESSATFVPDVSLQADARR